MNTFSSLDALSIQSLCSRVMDRTKLRYMYNIIYGGAAPLKTKNKKFTLNYSKPQSFHTIFNNYFM